MPKERLQKILAAAGIDSRRNCEQLILSGFVSVNGKIVDTLPVFADRETDIITVAGRRLRPEKKVYFLLNKPKGVLCTNYDPDNRRKAIDLIDCKERIFCVGRLDTETSGAIILTNDTAICDKLTHPRHQLAKIYVVGVKGKITQEAVEKLKKGIWLSDGRIQPAKVKILKAHYAESLLEIKITQSLNREIRRIMAKVGYKVTSLKRTQIGKISLHRLSVGCYRALTNPEVEHLKEIRD
ncbi:MAG: pseudouridine synthase [Phycisphaerae bacterium]|nr:pseudouridine synthase [Phycisphaerae bacterium]